MADFKALILGLDVVLQHPLAEGPHGGHVVDKNIVAEVAGAAVQGGHLGTQLGRLEALLRGHAGGAAGGGNQDDAGAGLPDGVQNHTEPLPVLGGGAVVGADMDVNDGRAGLEGALGLPHHFLHRVGDRGIVLLGDLRAADGRCDNQFFHGFSSSFH